MTRDDRISSVFWICFAVAICVESIRIGIGSLSNPGPGMIPLGSGLVLGVFGILVLVFSLQREEKTKEASVTRPKIWEPGARWKKMVGIPVSIAAYAFLIDILGFYLVTLFWMLFLCRGTGEIRWKNSVLISVITTFSSYLLFERYLHINFPRGLLSF